MASWHEDFVLGEWLVSPKLNRISKSGQAVSIKHKSMLVLVALADAKGEVLTRNEIMERLARYGSDRRRSYPECRRTAQSVQRRSQTTAVHRDDSSRWIQAAASGCAASDHEQGAEPTLRARGRGRHCDRESHVARYRSTQVGAKSGYHDARSNRHRRAAIRQHER